MQTSGGARLWRGGATASLATFAALLAHVAAGGAMPGPLGVAVPWILALPAAVALVGRRLPLLRTALGVGVSQALFHALFVLGVPTGSAAPGEHVHGAAATLSVVAPGASAASAADAGMTALHLIAALATIAYLRGAARLAAAGRGLVDRWLARAVLVATELAAPVRLAVPALAVAPATAPRRRARSRAPPA
ncbi:hypothetical protein [Agrococcus sp. BE272]|uniref:hypothetical protein n=1 Tax=Agrococcus sp. BE272 TaxID=2817727 RepID=UPI0028541FA8|nr:hypothetical protein [Agrococcus sp. BE272]MDR7233035.1 hypothetical protein [Agrococcus sp. BE272]